MAGALRRGDEHVVAFAHLREQRADIGVRQPHAAMGEGAAEQGFVIGAVQIDVTAQANRGLSPRFTPASSPSRVRMRVRMRSSSRGSPRHTSPVGAREANTVPGSASAPILRCTRCQPGGVR